MFIIGVGNFNVRLMTNFLIFFLSPNRWTEEQKCYVHEENDFYSSQLSNKTLNELKNGRFYIFKKIIAIG